MNGAVYYIDWTNIQQNVIYPHGGENFVGNSSAWLPARASRIRDELRSSEGV